MVRKWLFHEELAVIADLRRQGRLDEAEALLRQGHPTPAVLDELRKIASVRARTAARSGDWAAVVSHLESYTRLAQTHRKECIRLVNAEPPEHASRDQKLLEEARRKKGTAGR
jgi:hypothetical protein